MFSTLTVMALNSSGFARARHLAEQLMRSNWRGRTFGAREFSEWRKDLGGDLPRHVSRVFATLKDAGTIVPVAGHGPTREYRWAV